MWDQMVAVVPVLAGVLVGGALTWGQQATTARRQTMERRQVVYAAFHAAGRRWSNYLVSEDAEIKVTPADDQPDGHVLMKRDAQEELGRLVEAYAEVLLATPSKRVTDAATAYRHSLRHLLRSRAHMGPGKIPEDVINQVRHAADSFLAAARRDLGYRTSVSAEIQRMTGQ